MTRKEFLKRLRVNHKIKYNGTFCREYMKGKNHKGYGKLEVKGKTWAAHRYAYTLFVGPIPDKETQVLHGCDNRACAWWPHLRLGTNSDNQKDSYAKGRHHWARKRKQCLTSSSKKGTTISVSP